jgi:hypothetical protein
MSQKTRESAFFFGVPLLALAFSILTQDASAILGVGAIYAVGVCLYALTTLSRRRRR